MREAIHEKEDAERKVSTSLQSSKFIKALKMF